MRMYVIFDCDGVLVDSERIVNEVEAQVLTRWGWPVTEPEVRALFKGRPFADLQATIEQRLPGKLPSDWIYDWAMETACAMKQRLREVTGVRALIERLRAAGVPIAVASQSSLGRVRLSLALCGLDAYFGAHVSTASMVTRPKPAPDVYLHAAASLGAAPDACIVIEDSPSGVRAARAAGMTVYGYAADEDAAALAAAGAIVFRDMRELPGLLGI
jgi:HAD superfamily hydrolase (TIGR01509 family)